MANLLDGLLEDVRFKIGLLLAVVLVHEGEDTCVLHLFLRGRTRRIFRNFLHDFEHALEGVQHEPIGRIAEVNS